MELSRPLVFLDIEGTGLDVNSDRIVELGMVRIMPDGSRTEWEKRINPTIPIPKESTEIHGITDEDIKDCPTFKEVAQEVLVFMDNADLAGYNSSRYDVPLLANEMIRAGLDLGFQDRMQVDAMIIFHRMEPRDLNAAAARYRGSPLSEAEAHSAMGDVRATVEVFKGQLAAYPDLPRNLKDLAEWCYPDGMRPLDPGGKFGYRETVKHEGEKPEGVTYFTFGKYKGRSLLEVADLEPGYLDWMIRGNFSEEVKVIARDAKRGLFPKMK